MALSASDASFCGSYTSKIRHKQGQKHKEAIKPKTQTLTSPIYAVPIHPMVLLGVGVISIMSQQRRGTPGSGSWFESTQHGDADEGPLPRTTAHRGGPVSPSRPSGQPLCVEEWPKVRIYIDSRAVQLFGRLVKVKKEKDSKTGNKEILYHVSMSTGSTPWRGSFNNQGDRCS